MNLSSSNSLGPVNRPTVTNPQCSHKRQPIKAKNISHSSNTAFQNPLGSWLLNMLLLSILLTKLEASSLFSHEKETVDVYKDNYRFKASKVSHPELDNSYPGESIYLSVAHGFQNISGDYFIKNEKGDSQAIVLMYLLHFRDTAIFRTEATEAPSYTLSEQHEIPARAWVSNLHDIIQLNNRAIPLQNSPFTILFNAIPGESGSLLIGSENQIYGIQSAGNSAATIYNPIPKLFEFLNPVIDRKFPSNINRSIHHFDGSIEVQTGLTLFAKGFQLRQSHHELESGKSFVYKNKTFIYESGRTEADESSLVVKLNGKIQNTRTVYDTVLTNNYEQSKKMRITWATGKSQVFHNRYLNKTTDTLFFDAEDIYTRAGINHRIENLSIKDDFEYRESWKIYDPNNHLLANLSDIYHYNYLPSPTWTTLNIESPIKMMFDELESLENGVLAGNLFDDDDESFVYSDDWTVVNESYLTAKTGFLLCVNEKNYDIQELTYINGKLAATLFLPNERLFILGDNWKTGTDIDSEVMLAKGSINHVDRGALVTISNLTLGKKGMRAVTLKTDTNGLTINSHLTPTLKDEHLFFESGEILFSNGIVMAHFKELDVVENNFNGLIMCRDIPAVYLTDIKHVSGLVLESTSGSIKGIDGQTIAKMKNIVYVAGLLGGTVIGENGAPDRYSPLWKLDTNGILIDC